jgi:hypothetical protein
MRQQAQYIEALISHNDALAAKLATTNAATPLALPTVRDGTEPAPAPRPAVVTPSPVIAEPTLTPNADHVIDLVAAIVTAEVRRASESFHGAHRAARGHAGSKPAGGWYRWRDRWRALSSTTAWCKSAKASNRWPSSGSSPDAVLLRHSGKLLRLPVAEKAVRVRLPL